MNIFFLCFLLHFVIFFDIVSSKSATKNFDRDNFYSNDNAILEDIALKKITNFDSYTILDKEYQIGSQTMDAPASGPSRFTFGKPNLGEIKLDMPKVFLFKFLSTFKASSNIFSFVVTFKLPLGVKALETSVGTEYNATTGEFHLKAVGSLMANNEFFIICNFFIFGQDEFPEVKYSVSGFSQAGGTGQKSVSETVTLAPDTKYQQYPGDDFEYKTNIENSEVESVAAEHLVFTNNGTTYSAPVMFNVSIINLKGNSLGYFKVQMNFPKKVGLGNAKFYVKLPTSSNADCSDSFNDPTNEIPLSGGIETDISGSSFQKIECVARGIDSAAGASLSYTVRGVVESTTVIKKDSVLTVLVSANSVPIVITEILVAWGIPVGSQKSENDPSVISKQLGGGPIAGIVISVLVGISLIIGICYLIVRKKTVT